MHACVHVCVCVCDKLKKMKDDTCLFFSLVLAVLPLSRSLLFFSSSSSSLKFS